MPRCVKEVESLRENKLDYTDGISTLRANMEKKMSVLNEFPPKTQLVEMFKIKVAFDTAVTAASSSQDNFDG